MNKKAAWYEAFFAGLYGQVLGGSAHEDAAPDEARLIKRLLKLRKGQRVLDCPCGMGRITRRLAGLGLDVVGADLTASYIRRARRLASADGVNVRFCQCDMRELPFENEFDAVVNWFTSFGYFDETGNLATAEAAYRALKPGGKFLVEIINRSSLVSRFTSSGEENAGGVHIRRRSRWIDDGRRIANTWTLTKGRRRETHRFSHQLYGAGEIRSLLKRAGFGDIRLFGYPPLGRLTRHSRRMIAVGVKSKKAALT